MSAMPVSEVEIGETIISATTGMNNEYHDPTKRNSKGGYLFAAGNKGNTTLGAKLSQYLNALADLPMADLLAIAADPDGKEPSQRVVAAQQIIDQRHRVDIASFTDIVDGEQSLGNAKSNGLPTHDIRKIKVTRRTDKDGGETITRELEVHPDKRLDASTFVANRTEGTPVSKSISISASMSPAERASSVLDEVRRMLGVETPSHGSPVSLGDGMVPSAALPSAPSAIDMAGGTSALQDSSVNPAISDGTPVSESTADTTPVETPSKAEDTNTSSSRGVGLASDVGTPPEPTPAPIEGFYATLDSGRRIFVRGRIHDPLAVVKQSGAAPLRSIPVPLGALSTGSKESRAAEARERRAKQQKKRYIALLRDEKKKALKLEKQLLKLQEQVSELTKKRKRKPRSVPIEMPVVTPE